MPDISSQTRRTTAAWRTTALLTATLVLQSHTTVLATESSSDDLLQEIVVTATRRSEDVQKVPISIAALTHDDLEASRVKGIDQLAAMTPGVEYDQNGAYGTGTLTNISIRGVNSLIGSSTTGIYLDDTLLSQHVTPTSVFGNPYPVVFDLDRIEVLRGPQGTLFGSGSEGGTLRFIPNAPSLTQYSGQVSGEVAYTEYGAPSYETGAAFGGPIVPDEIGFRASAWYRRDGGYVDRVSPFGVNATVESNANRQDSGAVRLGLVAAPVEGLKITPSFYAQRLNKNDTGSFFEYLSSPGDGVFRNGRLLRQPSTDSLYLGALKVEADLGWSALTAVSSYTYRSADDHVDYTNAIPFSFLTPQYNGQPLPAPLTIASLLPGSESDASPVAIALRERVYTQEVRLSSVDPVARFKWTAGAYYSYDNQSENFLLYSAFLAQLADPSLPSNALAYRIAPVNTIKQIAAFGQADYKLTQALTAGVGVRVSHMSYDQVTGAGGFFGLVGTSSGDGKDTPVDPKFSLAYQLDPDHMVYASVGKGFREGGVNQPLLPPPICPSIKLPYEPDSLWSYEVGAKDRLFGGRLQIDSSAYHIKWNNIQVFEPLGCGGFDIINAGGARINGFDVAAQTRLGEHWKYGASLAYVDATYTSNVKGIDLDGNATIPFIQRSDALGVQPQVPIPWSGTVNAEYDFRIGSTKASVRAEDIVHSHNPGPYVSTVNSFLQANPATNLLNVSAHLAWDGYDVGLFVDNALNSHPRLNESNDGGGSPILLQTTFRPLTVGLSASRQF